jgi:branched-chain amino acid aminotransferase
MDRRIVGWDDAKIHVGAEALIRGISVFEGIKGYWSRDGGQLSLLALREHFDRLRRSALLQQLPFSETYENFEEACTSLIRRLLAKESDLWLRATLLAVEGHWGADTVTDLVITCYQQQKNRIRCMWVSAHGNACSTLRFREDQICGQLPGGTAGANRGRRQDSTT